MAYLHAQVITHSQHTIKFKTDLFHCWDIWVFLPSFTPQHLLETIILILCVQTIQRRGVYTIA